jgi:hypothetical protein
VPENLPQFEIVSPGDNQIFTDSSLTALVAGTAPRGISRVEYYINDNLLDTAYAQPFSLQKNISFLANGLYNLKARMCDDIDNCATDNVEFNLIVSNNNNSNKEVAVKLLEPANGLAINNIDFPLRVVAAVDNANAVARANFFYTDSAGNAAKEIAASSHITDGEITVAWKKIPPTGTYKIYCEIITWDKRSIKTPGTSLVVNNTATSTQP